METGIGCSFCGKHRDTNELNRIYLGPCVTPSVAKKFAAHNIELHASELSGPIYICDECFLKNFGDCEQVDEDA